jgi:hypothetical protein
MAKYGIASANAKLRVSFVTVAALNVTSSSNASLYVIAAPTTCDVSCTDSPRNTPAGTPPSGNIHLAKYGYVIIPKVPYATTLATARDTSRCEAAIAGDNAPIAVTPQIDEPAANNAPTFPDNPDVAPYLAITAALIIGVTKTPVATVAAIAGAAPPAKSEISLNDSFAPSAAIPTFNPSPAHHLTPFASVSGTPRPRNTKCALTAPIPTASGAVGTGLGRTRFSTGSRRERSHPSSVRPPLVVDEDEKYSVLAIDMASATPCAHAATPAHAAIPLNRVVIVCRRRRRTRPSNSACDGPPSDLVNTRVYV